MSISVKYPCPKLDGEVLTSPYKSAVTQFPHLTSLSWRSLRIVLFLLMWRRRSNTNTDRPAMSTASRPPTTPAAIMERPEWLEGQVGTNLRMQTENRAQTVHGSNQQGKTILKCGLFARSVYPSSVKFTHFLFWQPLRPGPTHLYTNQWKESDVITQLLCVHTNTIEHNNKPLLVHGSCDEARRKMLFYQPPSKSNRTSVFSK